MPEARHACLHILRDLGCLVAPCGMPMRRRRVLSIMFPLIFIVQREPSWSCAGTATGTRGTGVAVGDDHAFNIRKHAVLALYMRVARAAAP